MDFKVTPIQNSGEGLNNPVGVNPNIEPPVKRSFLSANLKKIIAGLVVILVIAGGLYLIFGRKSFSEGLVDFKIEGPNEISSGELVTYKITYQNNNKVALANVNLVFYYPVDSIVMKDGNPSSNTNDNINIGNLGVGESGEKDLTAFVIGDKGNIKNARGVLMFAPVSIASTFQKEEPITTTITSLAVPLAPNVPPNVLSGQTLTYLIDYRNESAQDFGNLRLKTKYPDGFKPISFSPQPTQGQDTWDIKTLKQGSGSRISVQGTISGNERDSKVFSVILQKKIAAPGGDVYINFEKSDASSVISPALLSVKARINDSSDYTAHLGDQLNYSINFRNNSDADLTDLALSVKLTGPMYDFSSVKSDGYFDSRINIISWNASRTPELMLLHPRQSGSVAFSVSLKSNFSGGAGTASSLVKASTHIETQNIPANFDLDRLQADDELVTRLSSQPTFDERVLLSDPIFGSSGPFPPKVNSKTTFTVRWTLTNPANAISPAKVTAVLPSGVNWENQARVVGTPNQPTYNQRANTVTWDLGALAGGTGITLPKAETDFQISITPSVNRVGQSVLLIKDARFDGTDTYTQEKISRPVQDITTDNVSDAQTSGSVVN